MGDATQGLQHMREMLAGQLKDAMKAGDKTRVGTLRLMMAALKDREIELRGAGKTVSRADELAVLTKMVKSRQESLGIYRQAVTVGGFDGKLRQQFDEAP